MLAPSQSPLPARYQVCSSFRQAPHSHLINSGSWWRDHRRDARTERRPKLQQRGNWRKPFRSSYGLHVQSFKRHIRSWIRQMVQDCWGGIQHCHQEVGNRMGIPPRCLGGLYWLAIRRILSTATAERRPPRSQPASHQATTSSEPKLLPFTLLPLQVVLNSTWPATRSRLPEAELPILTECHSQ